MVRSKYAVFLIAYTLSLTVEKLHHFAIHELNLVSVVQLQLTFLNGSRRRRLQGSTSFNLEDPTPGKSVYVPIEGFNLHVARDGYTGEDGFEARVG